ncbi:MAG: hypothetical protein JSS32_10435 [Verrucomicrobia bacterium]|nr:hypothetical protein [Verrucomicrobiota bacterium]
MAARIAWNTLTNIQLSLAECEFVLVDNRRCFRVGGRDIPVSQVADAIYARRPNFLHCTNAQLVRYFGVANRFRALLPVVEKSMFQKVTDLFWSCYSPLPSCWCTSACREKVIVMDSELGLRSAQEWRAHEVRLAYQ